MGCLTWATIERHAKILLCDGHVFGSDHYQCIYMGIFIFIAKIGWNPTLFRYPNTTCKKKHNFCY